MAGRVVKSSESGIEEFETSIAFVDLTSRDRSLLTKYLRDAAPAGQDWGSAGDCF